MNYLLSADDLIVKYRSYLESLKNADGVGYGKIYFKDKTSRLRALLTILDVRSLSNVNSRNFDEVCNKVKLAFAHSYKNAYGETVYKYSPYLVVVRQLYEMNTAKPAPRFQNSRGIRKVV